MRDGPVVPLVMVTSCFASKEPPPSALLGDSHLLQRHCVRVLPLLLQVASLVVSVVILIVLLVHNVHFLQYDQSEEVARRLSPSVSARFRLLQQQQPLVVPDTKLADVFISVKTSHKFHRSRLDVVVKTWFQLARQETWFFTDKDDNQLMEKTGGHLRVTDCPDNHSRQALSCKMAAELDAFLATNKSWFCHFDDDNYVNVPALIKKLREFDHTKEWYLGKPSISEPLEILDRDNMQKKLSFWFGTGGAGFCLSSALSRRLLDVAGGGRFAAVADKIRLPDDVTMGYLVEHVLGVPLTVVNELHSHLEPQRLLDEEELERQISFSYSTFDNDDNHERNVVTIAGWSERDDPTRFLSLHCHFFPRTDWCLEKSS